MRAIDKIPVTIITGFLGAGKTTFINQLLQKNPDKQFALVENEFGEVAIDTQLIKGVDASQMFELKQGCICCTITDEYEQVLQELAERFPNVEHLLIETTGIADPSPVIQPFFKDEQLKKLFDYKGCICLVDALNYESQPEKEIPIKQLAIADYILVNKSAQLSLEEKNKTMDLFKDLNPFAQLGFSDYGISDMDINHLLLKPRTLFDFVRFTSSHSHISSHTLTFERALNREAFLRWLEYTLDIYKSKIYRCKGILCFQNEPFEYILQGVGGNFELEEGNILMGEIKSQVVFIGKLDEVDFSFEEI